MGNYIPRFNPQKMEDDEILLLATGREKLLELMLNEMKSCLNPNGNQQFILYGPRGIGKSFFTQLLKVSHDKSKEFSKSIFIQFPEEQNNIIYVADILDMLSTKLEGGHYSEIKTRWEISDQSWDLSKKRIKLAIENIKKSQEKSHVFFTMENLQDFIPKLDDIENGRLREFLTDFEDITLIGSSLRPDMDNNYNKKLFQVFKKIQLEPWTPQNFVDYYERQAKIKGIFPEDKGIKKISENKIRAIANFSGGSPRIAVILNSLILDDDLITTIDIMDGVIDELTPYYQDLTKDIPQRSRTLFDLLIRLNENITQSELANQLNPPQEQSTIARSFNWLIENYYVTSIKQKKANVKNYYVRDRLYVLYYQTREVMADQKNSFIQILVQFLTEYYTVKELRLKLNTLDFQNKLTKPLIIEFSKYVLKESLDIKNDDYYKKILIERTNDLQNLYLKGKYVEYIIAFEKLDSSTFSPAEFFMAGSSYSSVDKNYEAIKAYENGISLATKYNILLDFTVYFNLGNRYNKIGELETALSYYQKAIQLNSELYLGYFNMAIIYEKIGQSNMAIENYGKSIILNPNDYEPYYNLGLLYGNLKINNEAINSLNLAVRLSPNNSELYYNLGYFFEELGDFKLAEENYKKAISLNNKMQYPYINLGALYNKTKQYKKGIDIYNQLISIDSKCIDSYIGIGFINTNINNYDEALNYYKKAILIDPNSYLANLNLGVLYGTIKKPELSIPFYLKCIEIKSNDDNVFNNLGYTYFELEKYEKAEENYLLALSIDKNNIYAYKNLFRLYIKTENFQKIKLILENQTDISKNIEDLTNALLDQFTLEKAFDFSLFLKVYHLLIEISIETLPEFFTILITDLYRNGNLELLRDIFDEIKINKMNNDSLNILIKTWDYILEPNDEKLISLHPDARIAVEAILEAKINGK